MKLNSNENLNSVSPRTVNDRSPCVRKNEASMKSVDNNGRIFSTASKSSSSKAKVKIPPTQKDVRKLFVGGIGRDVTNDEFHDFFSKFGKVIDSVVMFDRETQKPRGFGFVTFEDPGVALKLLGMGHEGETPPPGGFTSGRIKMHERFCEVKASEPKKQTNYRHSSKNSTSTTCSDTEERIPKQIQFQYGVGSVSSDADGYDARTNGVRNHDSRTAMYHPSNIEYTHVYDHQYLNTNYEYPAQPMPYFSSGGYYPAVNGAYYNPAMYHHPYQYFHPVPTGTATGQAPALYYPPVGSVPMYHPSSSGGGHRHEQNPGLEESDVPARSGE